jgi:hypothetical protein
VASHEESKTKIVFDVSMALELVKKHKLQPFKGINPGIVETAIRINDFDPAHLDHVDMSIPLLFANSTWLGLETPAAIIVSDPPVPREECNGNNSFMLFFLDGSHRAARAQRDGTIDQLEVYMLPEELTMQCMVSIEVGGAKLINSDAAEIDVERGVISYLGAAE